MAAGTVQIVVWNVAHGSAIYVKTPNSRSILLDAGSSDDFSPARWLHARQGLTALDLFVLSHHHPGHVRDLANVHQLTPPRTFRHNPTSRTMPAAADPFESSGESYAALDHLHGLEDAETIDVAADDPSPDAWGGLCVESFCNSAVEHALDGLNDYSVATFLEFGNLTFLFPGDLESAGWQALMKNPAFYIRSMPARQNESQIRVLVAPRHGHTAGLHLPFLRLYRPHLTIISGPPGDADMAYSSYAECTAGYDVVDRRSGQTRTRWVLKPKRNDFVLITSDDTGIQVIA
jgi:beta-lactamase superfamily II metal-dependent hydrolase